VDEKDGDRIRDVVREAKDLVKMLETTSVRRICLEAGSFKIELERAFTKGGAAPLVSMGEAPGEGVATRPNQHRILAPLVGTYYHSQSPGSKPFVEVGARVSVGQTVGIIEVMKVMNAVTSDVAGVVVELLVQNGHPVQYEQPLMVIDTAVA
jgi:acetyl-CoA carboxylase biotin carboxyl carrier protein